MVRVFSAGGGGGSIAPGPPYVSGVHDGCANGVAAHRLVGV